jgi:hypothetical protein
MSQSLSVVAVFVIIGAAAAVLLGGRLAVAVAVASQVSGNKINPSSSADLVSSAFLPPPPTRSNLFPPFPPPSAPLFVKRSCALRLPFNSQLLHWCWIRCSAFTWDPVLSYINLRRRVHLHLSVAGVCQPSWLDGPYCNRRFYARPFRPGICFFEAPAPLRRRIHLHQHLRPRSSIFKKLQHLVVKKISLEVFLVTCPLF